jgi:hypothetical protein
MQQFNLAVNRNDSDFLEAVINNTTQFYCLCMVVDERYDGLVEYTILADIKPFEIGQFCYSLAMEIAKSVLDKYKKT